MNRHRRLLADQRGFTMVGVMISMMILGMFAVGAWSAAVGDIPLARGDQDRKGGYEAAEAGLQWYAYQLQANPDYWQQCGSVPGIGYVRNEWNGAGADPRGWRTLPNSKAQFTIEVLDQVNTTTGVHTACNTSDPNGTALQNGTLRIRATGRANGGYRSVVATFRRRGFMDYIYFTQWETQDPIVSGVSGCDFPRSKRAGGCVNIQFSGKDSVNGPFHTNDESILACDSPTFGRPAPKADNFEVAGPSPGYQKVCGTGVPVINGPQITPANSVAFPSSNAKLITYAGPNWTFNGQTCLDFQPNDTVNVYQNQDWPTNSPGQIVCKPPYTNLPLTGVGGPPNGVIYVDNAPITAANPAGCSGVYQKYQHYTNTKSCGDVAVRGTYSQSITVGAANDIIAIGDVQEIDDSMLGLIADNFVRVYHPMGAASSGQCGAAVSYTPVYNIDAAILSLKHSFLVDNYQCLAPVTDDATDPLKAHYLNVTGAIAQYYRGTVAQSSGSSITSGYLKNYNYDDRLKFRSPPNFLDPTTTSWQIIRQSEQQPSTK
jgi:type II secretory pathway pseudopilin PulG